MERGALLSIMSLAASDLLFCVVTLCGSRLPSTKMIYETKDFTFYYTLYSNCLLNILVKVSTWFTVILAAGRYFVVCHPIKARKYLECKHTVVALLFSVLVWICLHIPLLLLWSVNDVNCPEDQTIYILTSGVFNNNPVLKRACSVSWFVVGFAVPVCILAFCNNRLICSLRVSKRLRAGLSADRKSSSLLSPECTHRQGHFGSTNTGQRRLTYTLTAIVILFFVCLFPSEVVFFYTEVAKPKFTETLLLLLEICNLLQAINFSSNFVLYCVVNGYFRRSLKQLCCSCCRRPTFSTHLPLIFKSPSRHTRSSVSTKSSVIVNSI